jgi:chloramphenicol-sensitive protein RarD
VSDAGPSQAKLGFLFGIVAYTAWGLIPLYFAEIRHVAPLEILSHRIVWSLAIMVGITLLVRQSRTVWRTLASRKLLITLTVSSLLLATNWLLYIYATVNDRVSEAGLGYFMMPLVNAFLGSVFLGERLRPLHYPALALIAVAVLVPVLAGGAFTWLAATLPISFGIYGVVRKKAPVDSLTGLTVESLLLAVPSVGFLAWQKANGGGQFLANRHDTLWLVFGGIATVVPLLTYTLSIRRLPLLAVSFIQFISPTMQILVAVIWLREPVSNDRWIAIGFVLAAVALFMIDEWRKARVRASRTT